MPVLRSVKKDKLWALCIWEPESPIVVPGYTSREEEEIFIEKCRIDGIPIYRRRTGGGTVILSPGMLVFSLAKRVSKPFAVREYAHLVNSIVLEYLANNGVKNLVERGHLDICIGNKKIIGSGMYLSREILFFQGSILINNDLSLFDRYLSYPPKEPDYRQGRSHLDFVTSLKNEGYNLTAWELIPSFYGFIFKNISLIH